MGDKTEQLEDLEHYPLKTSQNKIDFSKGLNPDIYQNVEMEVHIKAAMIDCIRHHEDLLKVCKEFDKQVTLFLFMKIADTNFLLTVMLFALVS